MSAGKLRDRLTIERASETGRDEHGKTIVKWSALATVWGRISPLSGKELFEAQQTEARTNTRILIRRYAGLTSRDRIRFGTRIFNLTYVPDEGLRQPAVALMAVEVS